MKMYPRYPNAIKHALRCAVSLLFISSPALIKAQAVSAISTDYNGYWETSATAVNPVKPDNHHHLLSFTYNNTTYSTGVNDALLNANGETFVPGQYQALPLQNVNGTPSSNTKIGLGAMADGVYNGAGAAPSRTLGPYLNDGTNGLDLGTCIANLPSGTMFMSVSNIQAAKIGDGIPDIVVTQIADPSTLYDSYEFTDVNGARIGNSLNVVLNNITPVGNWIADFYEATGSVILAPGFTQTQRAIRLWAADFSSFGLDGSNIGDIAYFKITLSSVSDIAFVAYNSTTVTVQQVLDLRQVQRLTRPATERNAGLTILNVSPNPSAGVIEVSHPEATAGDRLLILGNGGVRMKEIGCEKQSTKTTVRLFGLKPGFYYVIFEGGAGRLVKKIVRL